MPDKTFDEAMSEIRLLSYKADASKGLGLNLKTEEEFQYAIASKIADLIHPFVN